MTLPEGVSPSEEFFCARCRDLVSAAEVDWDAYDGAPDGIKITCVECSGKEDDSE